MSTSSIGIQTIMPTTGTSAQQTPPQPANDNVVDNAPKPPSPPPPGMGKFVDKTA